MKKNEKIELLITDMTKVGLGLAKVSGQVFFVKDALIGDKVLAIITKVDKNVVYAKTIKIIEASEYRVLPKCNYSNACGGCQLLNLDYKKQLELKKKYVLSCLDKLAKLNIEDYTYEGIISSDKIYYFRNKMQVPFAFKDGRIIYGFYASRTHSIIEFENCVVGFNGSNLILKSIKNVLEKFNLSIYDEKTNNGIFREVMLRKGNFSDEVSITYILNDKNYYKNLDLYKKFDNKVLEEYKNKYSFEENINLSLVTSTININTDDNNVLFGNINIVIRGNGYISDSINEIKYHISPESFYQVNIDMTKKLYDSIIDFADFNSDETVLDLYCGIGTISLYIAKYVKNVCGIDIVSKAIENAKENALLNNINNVTFLSEDLSKNEFQNKLIKNIKTFDSIIVDPPRKGLDKNTIDFINNINPNKIIYVSCDPATFSRDITLLCNDDTKYKLLKVKNIDMFPHTMHIETVSLIKKINY